MNEFTLFDGKVCVQCGEWDPIERYEKRSGSSTKRIARCRRCRTKRIVDRYWKRKAEAVVVPAEDGVKKCNRCGEEKPVTEFHKNLSLKDGRDRRCGECDNRRQREQHKANPEIRRAWKANHREQENAWLRGYRERYPEMAKMWALRRLRLRLIGGRNHTYEEWIELCERYGNRCLCCGETKPLAEDHIVPLSVGGHNGIDNIQPLCKSCNSRKHVSTIDYRPKWDTVDANL